ncbi:AMP-binding protein [Pseudonocardia kunmingensis]|uniref:Fatty-acyl-CoA synthase n=1 Tax=Pseudonocardia kunmingensis TaxID=630975 RepID=A0A543DL60_9PSEU|nr:AMP-binding protein [Pseudonocardia kunmingensis]TQM10096.1 fatty-acyl-CoA synthase [Pseudonocardia kunmingensis]
MRDTLTGLLAELVERRGDRPALLDPATGRVTTFAALDELARRAATGLSALGVGRGDRVAVWLPNLPEWLAVQFAVARLGAVVVAVNTRFRAQELADILRVSGASVLVLTAGYRRIDFAGILAEARAKAGLATDLVPVAVGHGDAPDGALSWNELIDHPPRLTDDARPEDAAAVFATSGSTGVPKLAVHRQVAIVTHARNDVVAFDMAPGEVSLCALPLCGVFGFNAALSALASGATTLLPAAFDAAESAEAIARHGVTHFHAADNMLRDVLAVARDRGLDLSTWREGAFAAFSGGGAALVREVEDTAGARITGVYGASELFALVARWPRDWDAEARSPGGGFPVGDIEVRATDPGTGAVRPHGEPGELQFRGYNVAAGYLGNPEASAAAFLADGWYRSGDLGHTRDDGAFVYLSRMKDSLRLRGFLTDPGEIEQHLQRHPDVSLAQVVGVPAPDGGDAAVAFVQLRPHATAGPDDLVEHCRRDLAGYKVPSALHLVTDWPTVEGANGRKIQRFRLRDRALQLGAR